MRRTSWETAENYLLKLFCKAIFHSSRKFQNHYVEKFCRNSSFYWKACVESKKKGHFRFNKAFICRIGRIKFK